MWSEKKTTYFDRLIVQRNRRGTSRLAQLLGSPVTVPVAVAIAEAVATVMVDLNMGLAAGTPLSRVHSGD